jgi:FkbM family methyltransferase
MGSRPTLKHALLGFINRVARPLDVHVERRSRTTPAIRQRILAAHGIEHVIDVGAHFGEYSAGLRSAGYRGSITSFEPIPEAFQKLHALASKDAQWTALQCALGAETGRCSFHVSANEVSSSLRRVLPRHVAAAPQAAEQRIIDVEVRRLDDLNLFPTDGMRNLLLKLDVQGSEDLVLAGSTSLLRRVELIELELSLQALYQGQLQYLEQLDRLQQLGFDLVWLERGFVDMFEPALLQIDALLARSNTPR